jgi:chromosome segregation protein
MEVAGFKSFADHIKLDFEPGLTAVVGPNGCGKSNIIDAIRWCLGEMSAKSLRSNLMMDVIFNGSGSRPAQNLSEVTLTFDNTDKRLPIDFTDVSITRKLFRSGESEYFINKTQCRLRDIKELFLDTGMGEDGYSSMEQGKVEWILQAKPEERRELFEEAAGVSKYRARREEALRKMERVEIDLSRLADIITVTQDQIRKLENAVNKAQTYQRLRDQLKQMEIGDWLFQLEQSDVEMKVLAETLANLQTKAETLNTDVHTMDAELSTLRLAATETEEALLKANSTLAQIDADIKISEERLAGAKQREQELTTQLDSIRQNIQREESRIAQLAEQEVAQAQALTQVEAEGTTIEADYAASKNSHDAALKNLETKRSDVKSLRDIILERAQARSRAQQELGKLTSDLSRIQSDLENRQKEERRSEESAEVVKKTIEENAAQHAALSQQLTEKTELLGRITDEQKALNTQEEELRKELLRDAEEVARLKGQIHTIQNEQSRDPYLSGTQAILSAGLRGISGPLGRVISCDNTDKDIVSSILGEHLGDLLADSDQDANEAIEFLRANHKGRARIWILDRLPQSASNTTFAQIPGAVQLISRIKADEKYLPLLSNLLSSYWMHESNVYGQGLVNGGVDPSQWKSHTNLRLPELEAQLTEKEETRQAKTQALQQCEENQIYLVSKREVALKEMEEVRIRLEMNREENVRLCERTKLHEEEQSLIEMEILQLEEDRNKTQAAFDEKTGTLANWDTQEREDHFQLDLRQQEVTELQQIYVNCSSDLSAKTERHNSFTDKLNWQKSILEHTRRDAENIRQSVAHNQKMISQTESEIESSKNAQGEAQNQIENALAQRNTAAENCSQIQTQRVALSEKMSSLQDQLSVKRDELSQTQEQLQAEKIHETNVKNRLEMVSQKLQDQYEMSFDTAKAEFKPEQADAETLEKLKKRVSGMGPVNLAAPQEHAELMEKNTFLTNQQNDLLTAKDDLREVISKINATTREHFRETFYKVRDNFRALYAQLFNGGEADLRFTNEADILSTGIDIFCQPPGKKLLHISLLSGGEKALTAAALLFAFFQVRPSPLALLDEVDAPLDEANVLRFVDMIKLFSEKSQFIIISHNKRTMEAANTLYGVTMESLGVSKVLSARLTRERAAALTAKTEEPAAAS